MLDPKQLIWRCRRGVRELDVLFARFLQLDYPDLNNTEKQAFERLLEVQDPIIIDWLFGRYPAEDIEIANLIKRLKITSNL